MATLISKATGNLTAAGTWAPVEPGASASQPSHSANTTIAGGANASSPNFTGTNANQCDGVLLWLRMAAAPTGTVLVELQKGGVTQASVTVDCADIPLDKSPVFFKFTAAHTFDGSATYSIKVSVSAGGSTLTYYRNATAANFTKQLRLTSAASAPAATDVLDIVGELTGQGTSNSFTVTMDSTGSVTLGTDTQAVTTVPHSTDNGVTIGKGGTLTWSTAAGTNQLHVKGHVQVWGGGTLNMGTTGTPIPNGSVAEMYFDNAANVKFGLEMLAGSTVNMQGLTKTRMQYLDADAASGVAAFTLDDIPTNWKSGDEVVLTSTTISANNSEVRTLSADVTTTAMSTTANSGFAHAGAGVTNGPLVKAEVVNVTRNVRVKGNNASTGYAYVIQQGAAACDFDYAEFKYVGASTASKRGVECQSQSGSYNLNGCVVRDQSQQAANALGFYMNSSTGLNYVLNECVGWTTGVACFQNVATAATGWQITNCIGITPGGAGECFTLNDLGGTLTGLTGVSAPSCAFNLLESGAAVLGTIGSLIGHSCANGLLTTGSLIAKGTIISDVLMYRCGGNGINQNSGSWKGITIDGYIAFGNFTAGIRFGHANVTINCLFKNWTIDGGLVALQPIGILFSTQDQTMANCIFENVQVGKNQTHATADISITSPLAFIQAQFVNPYFGSTVEMLNQTNMHPGSAINSQKHDETAGNHKTWRREGTISTDTAIFDIDSPSARLAPLQAAEKLECEIASAEVNNGETVAFNVKVRKSEAGDGAAYNGNEPRLILKKNVGAGINDDVVLDTAVAAAGAWETLTGTSPAVNADEVLVAVVDCDGTAGWVNADTSGVA